MICRLSSEVNPNGNNGWGAIQHRAYAGLSSLGELCICIPHQECLTACTQRHLPGGDYPDKITVEKQALKMMSRKSWANLRVVLQLLECSCA